MKCKKIISLFLSALTVGGACFFSFSAQAATKPPLLIGDADRDGSITIGDVTALQRVLAELDTFDEQTAKMAKTDFSREALTIADATLLQQHLAEIDAPAAREVGHAAYVWKGSKYVEALPEYERYVKQQIDNNKFSGVGYVTRNGRVLAQYANGTANTAEGLPVTMDTRFCIGSVSKHFCAAAVLLLQEQGRLRLDDTLAAYFPSYTIGKDVTLHQLLAQRSGIRDYLSSDVSYTGHEYPLEEFSLSEENTDAENEACILNWLFTQELKFTPGSNWAYSNSNFLLAALVVEKVTGASFYDFVRENIFAPLGMTHSDFFINAENDADLAEHYFTSDNPVFDGYTLTFTDIWVQTHCKGDGGIVSNAADMDKWMTALEDGTLLSEESTNALFTDYSDGKVAPNAGYGYGLILDANGCLSHEGRELTYQSAIAFIPSEHLHVFIANNNDCNYNYNVNLSQITANIVKKVNQ